MPPLPVAVVDDDAKTRARLAMQLGEDRATPFADIESLNGDFAAGSPFVAVFGPAATATLGVDAIGDFCRRRPEVATIVVVEELTTQVLQSALRAGIRDVLQAPANTDQLTEAIARVSEGLAPVAPRATSTAAADGHRGTVITVFSTKGGSGKSVLASNLAVSLKRRVDGDVALVDADLQFGDVAVMLKLTPQHTIIDAAGAVDRIDASLIRSLLAEHKQSGVLVLPAPIDPAFSDQVGPQHVSAIISALRELCDFIVVDTPAYFNDVVLSLIDESDEIVLVGGMDVPNIKNVKIGLQTLRLLNVPMTKVRLVLNRANSKVKLEVGEVERTLQMKADCLIPSEIVVPQSVNKSVPAVIDAPKSGVARAIETFADELVEANRPAMR